MYTEITEKFKSDCRELNNMTMFILVPIMLFIIAIAVSISLHNNACIDWLAPVLILLATVFSLLNYYLIVLFSIKNEPQFSKKNFWSIVSMVELYQEVMHKKDIKILINILKNSGVNTMPKVLEVLRHYQICLPRKIIGGSQIISILALTISTLAFVFSDILSMSFESQIMTLIIIMFVLFIYLFGYVLNKRIFHYFGEAALYIRIESAVSEIWMKSLIK